MMPVYRYMDSSPHRRDQVPFPQHFFPGFEAVPPHLKVDPSNSPMMFESWPCSSNYGYSVPSYSCYNHGNFPACYSFRPPCPHFAPPPAFHHYPNYPTFPEAYPVYYFPPPHHSNEQPRYEYNKDAHGKHHCCGCPNHPCNQKNERSLKIEEQEPDAEKKEGDSVVSIQPRSYPYPVVWIPPEYVKNKEYGKRIDQPEVSDWDKAPHFTKYFKSLKPTEQEPRVWNGWFPLDMNGLKSLMQGEGERKTQNQQNEDKMRQFLFPIFGVPSDTKQEEDENQDKRKWKTASDHSKQAPNSFEFVPVESSGNDGRTDKPQVNEEFSHNKSASEIVGKADKKCASVKQMEVHREDKSEGTEKRGRDASVKRIEDTAKNELGGTTAKGKSPSPQKTSKLPPVCLRVDPLPKKRNGNGSSRSPSPPKGQAQDTSTKACTALGLQEEFAVCPQNLNGSLGKVEPGKKERKNIQVIEETCKENKAGECTSASQAQVLGNLSFDSQGVSRTPISERTESYSHKNKLGEEKSASSEEVVGAEKAAETIKATNLDKSAPGQCKAETKRMSDAEAAKLIQSAYRGFEVRKWDPLKKLKQIAKAREQVDEIRNRIQALESFSDPNKDDRQRLLIGEMIMSLPLKLDSIQGLHSCVRDARKSLARELLTAQEKLDSLSSKFAEGKVKELATAASTDYPRVDACRNASIEKENKKTSGGCISSFEDTNENGNNVKEPEQENLSDKEDKKPDAKDEETTEPPIADQELDGKIENEPTEVSNDIERHTAQSTPIMELENEDMSRIQDGDLSPNLECITHLPSAPEQKSNADEFSEMKDLTKEGKSEVVEVNDLILVSNNSEEDKLRSLPKEMIDCMHTVCEPEKKIGNSNGEKESDLPINQAFPAEVENLRCTKKDQEIDLLEELPLGIIDEEPAISKFEKCELHETGENNILSSTEGHLAGCQADEQLPEAASDNCVKGQNENDFTKSPALIEVEQTQEKEVNNVNKLESVLKPEEVPSTVGEENNDKVHQEEDDYGMIPVDHMAFSESEAGIVATQEKEVLFEEKKELVDQPVGTEEKEEIKLENQTQVQEQECTNSKDKATDMLRETAEHRVLSGTDALSEPNVEQDLLSASPAASEMSNDDHDLAEIGGDNKLIEENRKLREMMEKLMEAGKHQLTVISNLTGRVEDLEEKLSRNKKLSKPRYRKAIYGPSYSRPLRVRGKAAEVAM
ncbi:hypothetical protein QUC31_005233 [Theobroma cacao]